MIFQNDAERELWNKIVLGGDLSAETLSEIVVLADSAVLAFRERCGEKGEKVVPSDIYVVVDRLRARLALAEKLADDVLDERMSMSAVMDDAKAFRASGGAA